MGTGGGDGEAIGWDQRPDSGQGDQVRGDQDQQRPGGARGGGVDGDRDLAARG
jgi:hypothetical protein